MREGVEAKLCPDGDETFVLVRSAQRAKKERAMHERFAARIEAGLASLERRLARTRKPLRPGARVTVKDVRKAVEEMKRRGREELL